MPCGATQDGRVMVERSDRMWSIGEGNGKPLQYSCLENPMNSMKRQKERTLKDELPRSIGAQYATGDQWRNNSRKNEGMEPKQKQYPVVDVTSDRSKVQCCKQQYCIGTWNVRSMNQGKLLQSMGSQRVGHDWVMELMMMMMQLGYLETSWFFQFLLLWSVRQDWNSTQSRANYSPLLKKQSLVYTITQWIIRIFSLIIGNRYFS